MNDAERPSASAVARLNALPEPEAQRAFARCCGAKRWVQGMLEGRPYESSQALLGRADTVWSTLEAPDYLEAFSHHPEIGANIAELRQKFAATAELSQHEQAGAAGASDETLHALRRQNRAYHERFGYLFIVCASGKSAREKLANLEARQLHAPDTELGIAAAEQAKITRLRLEQLP
jgi:2-oxo-4-hydroxy-4-carboxy-5-ureidoimidazoline decarboxylase